MARRIKVGDVLRRKSGRPVMTVTAIDKGYAGGGWFDDGIHRETLLLLETPNMVEVGE